MKKLNVVPLFTAMFLFGATGALAQEITKETDKEDVEVKKYTVMERFEPKLMLSAEERLKLKEERIAEIKRKSEVLDTMDISERRRQKLMLDLLKDPFSPRLAKTLADIKFEDDEQ